MTRKNFNGCEFSVHHKKCDVDHFESYCFRWRTVAVLAAATNDVTRGLQLEGAATNNTSRMQREF